MQFCYEISTKTILFNSLSHFSCVRFGLKASNQQYRCVTVSMFILKKTSVSYNMHLSSVWDECWRIEASVPHSCVQLRMAMLTGPAFQQKSAGLAWYQNDRVQKSRFFFNYAETYWVGLVSRC